MQTNVAMEIITQRKFQFTSIREKCPNAEFVLVHIFLYSVQIQEKMDQKRLRIWTLFKQCMEMSLAISITSWLYKITNLNTKGKICFKRETFHLTPTLWKQWHNIDSERIKNGD